MTDRTIDRALIDRVARLASLSLSEDEAARLSEELAKIVEYVAVLEGVDTSQVPALATSAPDPEAFRPASARASERAAEACPLRVDVPRAGLSHEDALAQAPQVEGDGFAVPAFVEEK